MRSDIYIINSPSFPEKLDFENFGVWCEWHDSEEVPYLKSLCSSELEFEEIIIKPYEEGKETYYPVVSSYELPDHDFLYVQVMVNITVDIKLMGYVSISENEIVLLTIWPNDILDDEVDFYRSDRLVAEDENPVSVSRVSKSYKIGPFFELNFSSKYRLSNGTHVNGRFNVSPT